MKHNNILNNIIIVNGEFLFDSLISINKSMVFIRAYFKISDNETSSRYSLALYVFEHCTIVVIILNSLILSIVLK
jgi:hypothetical protein